MLTDAIYLNPAYASFVPTYSLSSGYTWFDAGRNYNVSVQDSRTELFQAGIGFTRREQNAVFNIGASKLAVEKLGFGLGMKVLIDDATKMTQTGLTFSTTFLLSDQFYAALIIDNLFESEAGRRLNLHRDFILGTKTQISREISLYFDPSYSPNYTAGKKAGLATGVEFSLLADFYLRAGKFFDSEVVYLNTRGDGFGVGVGWIGPKVNFEYALHRVTLAHNGTGVQTSNSGSITIFF
jgi:hypothetical protein